MWRLSRIRVSSSASLRAGGGLAVISAGVVWGLLQLLPKSGFARFVLPCTRNLGY